MELVNGIELIPKRFYWMAKSKPPINTGNVHYFNIDKVLLYQPFASDFGPLSASCLVKYVRIVDSKMLDPALATSRIVHYCNTTPAAKSNSAVLAIIYTVMTLAGEGIGQKSMSDLTPIIDSVFALFRSVQLMPFRDASGGPPTYSLSVGSVVRGMIKAMNIGYYNPRAFSTREYDFYEKVENGDMTWIIPKKVMAFAGPEDPVYNTQNGFGISEHYALPPGAYIPYFQKHNIRTVIRLNAPRYRRESFEARGIRVLDLIFPDGSCPTSDISNAFATEIDNGDRNGYAIAVHCKAGLGRTGTLIGMVLMTRGFTAPEAIGYLRVMRPGSVVAWQQNFMLEKELQCRRHELAVPKRLLVSPAKKRKDTNESSTNGFGNNGNNNNNNNNNNGSYTQVRNEKRTGPRIVNAYSIGTQQHNQAHYSSSSMIKFSSVGISGGSPSASGSRNNNYSKNAGTNNMWPTSIANSPYLLANDHNGTGSSRTHRTRQMQSQQLHGHTGSGAGVMGMSSPMKSPSQGRSANQYSKSASINNGNNMFTAAFSTGRVQRTSSRTETTHSSTRGHAERQGHSSSSIGRRSATDRQYVHLPNLQEPSPHSHTQAHISPQPRKAAGGRFIETVSTPM